MALICVSLMIDKAFICFLDIFYISFANVLFKSHIFLLDCLIFY